MGLAETAELAVRISLKDNASAGIRGLQRNLKGLSGSVGRVGRGFGQIGTGLTRAGLVVGGAAVAGIGAAAKAAIDFEDAFAGVRKTVNESDLAEVGLTFDDLATSFRNMATEIPIAATDLARIGETAGALGIEAADIEEFTKTVALLGETTNLSSDAAAEALGKVGTILHLTGDDFEDFADTLVNLGNQGASTESEIIEVTKRFAAVGRQAGLTTDEILALSSAATSLGAEPEAAGSALSRIFANMTTEIANGSAKGKEFARITGDSLGELRKRLDKGDALGILQETLAELSTLSRTEGASVLKALGITNVRDRDAILKMAQNLDFVNEQLQIAKESEGALFREAEKRFATTASKIQLAKNNLIETGIAMGTEMLPAVQRALDKVIGVLKDPKTQDSARQLGKDIGKFIDDIDWQKVAEGASALKDAMKGAVDFAMTLLGILDKLPNELKGALIGFLALNKLSGGLVGAGVGNIVGGLGETVLRGLGSKLPGVGKLFAQPVFVTNWPMGGLGGAGGVAGAGGGLAGAVGLGIAGAVGVQAVQDAGTVIGAVDAATRAETPREVLDIQRQMLNEVVLLPPGLRELGQAITNAQQQALASVQPVAPQGMSPDERQASNDNARRLNALDGRLEAVKARAAETRQAVDRARVNQVAAIRTGDAAIVAAIRANRTIVNVSYSSTTVRRASGSTVDWRYRDRKVVPDG